MINLFLDIKNYFSNLELQIKLKLKDMQLEIYQEEKLEKKLLLELNTES
jgi:hypothetical protein